MKITHNHHKLGQKCIFCEAKFFETVFTVASVIEKIKGLSIAKRISTTTNLGSYYQTRASSSLVLGKHSGAHQ